MIENKGMKWIVIIILLAVVGFAYYLYVADWKDPKATFVKEAPQPYVTAQVDASIARRKLYEKDTARAVQPTMQLMVARMDTDSMRINLHRPLQEVVNIDMEEHKEALFFTWEDLKSYYYVVLEYFDKKKHKNDDHSTTDSVADADERE